MSKSGIRNSSRQKKHVEKHVENMNKIPFSHSVKTSYSHAW